jgi:hypothetical protein
MTLLLEELLNEPINELEFSLEFKKITHQMGFIRLRDIVAEKEKTIMAKTQFNHIWFSELIWFAIKNEFVNLLEARHRF